MTTERRSRSLTDEDIASVRQLFADELRRLDDAWATRMESIGFDVTTPASRKVIAANNSFVTDLRTGAAKARVMAWGTGISTLVGGALYLFWLALKSALSAKGAA